MAWRAQRAIIAAEETETRAKQLGAKTSIRDDIAEHSVVLGTLRSKQDLENAIASRLLPRVKAAMDIAANHNLVDTLMTEVRRQGGNAPPLGIAESKSRVLRDKRQGCRSYRQALEHARASAR